MIIPSAYEEAEQLPLKLWIFSSSSEEYWF